jgi:hypothetical protein
MPQRDHVEGPERRQCRQWIVGQVDRDVKMLSDPGCTRAWHLEYAHCETGLAREQSESAGSGPNLEQAPGIVRPANKVKLVLLDLTGNAQIVDRRAHWVVRLGVVQRQVGGDVPQEQQAAHAAP